MNAPFLKLNVEHPYGEPGTFIGDERTALVARLYPGQEHYAPLFASAPDLLAALERARDHLLMSEGAFVCDGTLCRSHDWKEALKQASEAIARAKGAA
jgi:hypothetical protein